MSAEPNQLTDVGPATPAPNWCLPDAEPEWNQLTERCGGGMVCSWTRNVSDDVWIECEDRIVDGRVMRSAPRIMYWEPPADGITCEQARQLAEGLTAAGDIITCAAFEEAAR
jgi:hypothetical protein